MNCPSEFVMAPTGNACIYPCPQQYQLVSDGVLSCAYQGDNTIRAQLNPVPMYEGEPSNYNDLPNNQVYKDEVERFKRELAVADGKISKDSLISNAFKALQDAENVRDKSPEAYEKARVNYYTLVNGDSWAEQEKARIATVEAQPFINSYMTQFNDLDAQIKNQQSSLEVMNGIKDKVLSVKDDMMYSVMAFQRQISEIKNQMNMDKKKHVETAMQTSTWMDTLLNWIIIITTLVAIFFIARYAFRSKPAFSAPASLPT